MGVGKRWGILCKADRFENWILGIRNAAFELVVLPNMLFFGVDQVSNEGRLTGVD